MGKSSCNTKGFIVTFSVSLGKWAILIFTLTHMQRMSKNQETEQNHNKIYF